MMERMNNPKTRSTFSGPGGLRRKLRVEPPQLEEDATVPDGCVSRSLNKPDGRVYKLAEYAKHDENRSVLIRFAVFFFLILFVGIGSFYFLQDFMVDGVNSSYPPLIAFALVQGLTFLYAYLAWNDDDLEDEENIESKKAETKKNK
eukprot:GHVH01007390.1.p1 GENE.GHVH01007390.1~~GHVH01007390.1.p1  ORF type:complete len:146 (+),score=27.65 GHVH01007390.1:153-590(+)